MSRRLLATVIILIACASVASAQTRPPAKGPAKEREFLVGGLFAGPTSLGTTQADLLTGTGDEVTLARTRNRLASGFGAEVILAYQLKRTMWFEVTGGWTRLSLKSDIREDLEDAQGDSVVSPVSRFTVGGAARFSLSDRGKSSWFLRTEGSWMRETAGGNTLTGDGFLGGAGIGMRRWWTTGRKGKFNRIGLRVEGRAVVRVGGLSLGESSFRIGPAAAAHLVFGY